MMHEGASGGGKSELLQDVMRSADGRVLLGVDLVSGEEQLHLHERHLYDSARHGRHGHVPAQHPGRQRQALPHRRRGRLVRPRGRHYQLRLRPAVRAHLHKPQRAADVPQPAGRAPRHLPALGARARLRRQALPEPARHSAAPHDSQRGQQARRGRRALLRRAHAARHGQGPDLRHHGPHADSPARAGLALAARGPARLQEPQHLRRAPRWPARASAATGPSPPASASRRPTCCSSRFSPARTPATCSYPTSTSAPTASASPPSG